MKERIKAFAIFVDYIFLGFLKFMFNYVLAITMPFLILFYSVNLFTQYNSIEGFVLAFHVFFFFISVWLIIFNELKSKILNKYESI